MPNGDHPVTWTDLREELDRHYATKAQAMRYAAAAVGVILAVLNLVGD